MAKLDLKKLSKPSSSTFKGWSFVVVAGVVLAIIAVLDRGGLGDLRGGSTGATGCVLEVGVAELNVRSGPNQDASVVEQLIKGDRVDGVRNVKDGFRELTGARWAFDQYLMPVSGSTCS